MKSLIFLLLSTTAFAGLVTPYNVTVQIQDAAGNNVSAANKGVFILADYRWGSGTDIGRRYKAKTNANGQAIIAVDKGDFWLKKFDHLELFCLNLEDALYCNGSDEGRETLNPLNTYLGTDQNKIKHSCLYSLKNPSKDNPAAGNISVICKALD